MFRIFGVFALFGPLAFFAAQAMGGEKAPLLPAHLVAKPLSAEERESILKDGTCDRICYSS